MDKDRVLHKHGGILFSHEKNEIWPLAAIRMGLEISLLTEVSQTKKDKCYMISLICGVLKNNTNESICKTEVGS